MTTTGNEKTYIVMDLEMNNSGTRFLSEKNGIMLGAEIIEFGAVKLDGDLNQIDEYCRFVKPTAYPKVNNEVRELTGITTKQIWEGELFPDVVREFLGWCGEDAVFITWSVNDINVLEDNMLYHGMDIEQLTLCYAIQLMFDDQVTNEGRDFALSYAMWKYGITPARSHDALNDAINTAEVFRRLDLSEGLDEYEI